MSEQSNDRIRAAVDQIEPADGARDRMLVHIQAKAEKTKSEVRIMESSKKKPSSFANIAKWALPIAACLTVVIVGAVMIMNHSKQNNQKTPNESTLQTAKDQQDDENTMVVNPYQEVDGPEAFEKDLGFRIDAPEGAGYVLYIIIAPEHIADVRFTLEGHEYTLRGCKVNDDISGLYGDVKKTEELGDDRNAVLTVLGSGDESYLKISWKSDGVNYELMNTDGASEEEIESVYGLIK